jgi:hypothetical protein
MQVGLHRCRSCPACFSTRRILAFDDAPTEASKLFVQRHQHHNRFADRYFCVQKMSTLTIENLPPEVLLQICELLRDTHRASNHSFSETSRKIRRVAAMHLFQEVLLPIRSHESVGDPVRQLSDALGPISALGYIRKLRLSKSLDTYDRDELRYPANWFRSDMALAEVVWTYDHAWKPVAKLLQRCPALSDLEYELDIQLAPCVLDALHQYHPRCRLHLRTFCARSLMGSEPDKHELALASSPCLRSVWFSYMEPLEDDFFATRSQRVVQEVITRLAPNVEVVRFRRTEYSPRGNPGWRDIKLPAYKDNFDPSISVRRLEIHSRGSREPILAKEFESWYKRVDFSVLHTLNLGSPLEPAAQAWLTQCDLPSLKALTFNFIGVGSTESPFARPFLMNLPPLSELAIRGIWDLHDMTAVYQKHGASLRKLRFNLMHSFGTETTASILTKMRDSCPLLAELELNILRDQGSLAETSVYKTLATFPILRRLILYLVGRNYEQVRAQGRMPCYDDFDRQLSGRYGDIRRTFIDRAIDENLAATIFRLVSPPDSVRGLKELVLLGNSHTPFGTQSATYAVTSHVCRSWKIKPGVRDDRPDEVVVQEVTANLDMKRKPAPKDLRPYVEKIFRRIWPGSEDGTGDWRNDWHGILQLEGDAVTE